MMNSIDDWDFAYNSLKILCAYGADLNVQNAEGKTPLHIICERGARQVLLLALQQEDTDVTIQDDEGMTPLALWPDPEDLIELEKKVRYQR
jgi:ankyrin repeat protein